MPYNIKNETAVNLAIKGHNWTVFRKCASGFQLMVQNLPQHENQPEGGGFFSSTKNKDKRCWNSKAIATRQINRIEIQTQTNRKDKMKKAENSSL